MSLFKKSEWKELLNDDSFEKVIRRIARIVYEEKYRVGDTSKSIKTRTPELAPPQIKEIIKEVPVTKEVIKELKVMQIPDWARGLESQLAFLQNVRQHTELAAILLPQQSNKKNESELLLQLISNAAQLSKIKRVWEILAQQVKSTQQPISAAQQVILTQSLALFNLTTQSNPATLKSPSVGDRYDYQQQFTVNGQGDKISQVLLSGLYNAGGEKIGAAVVLTH